MILNWQDYRLSSRQSLDSDKGELIVCSFSFLNTKWKVVPDQNSGLKKKYLYHMNHNLPGGV